MEQKTKILDPQKRKTSNGMIWQGAFITEHYVGLFQKTTGQNSEILNYKSNNKSSDVAMADCADVIIKDIDDYISQIEKSEEKDSIRLSNTRDIHLDVGPIITARTTGIIYQPELTILSGDYRLVWQWEISCLGSIASKCKALPGLLTIIHKSKETKSITPDNSSKWNNLYNAIKTAIGENPKNLVINILLDKSRYI